MEDRLLTTVEAAALLGYRPRALEDWRLDGKGPRYVTIGNRVRYRMSDLQAYIAGLSA